MNFTLIKKVTTYKNDVILFTKPIVEVIIMNVILFKEFVGIILFLKPKIEDIIVFLSLSISNKEEINQKIPK